MEEVKQRFCFVSSSIWTPLKYKYFRVFWICVFISSLGTWVQDVAASWVMTHLSSSPLVIALLSVANSAPLMLLSIPAGYLADTRDRRKVLLLALAMMLLASLFLGINVWNGQISNALLLTLTGVMGVGAALSGPAFQTVVTDLVPNEEQQNSILVFYMGVNATRVLGPALGGGVLSSFGPSAAFWINSVSFLGLIVFVSKWPLPKRDLAALKQIKADSDELAVIFSVHNIRLWIEILIVTFSASCLWALYPAKGRVELMLNSWQYGSLLGCLGLGACVSALFSKKLMGGATAQSLAIAYLFFALGLLCLGYGNSYPWMCGGMFLAGTGWIVLATLMNMSSRQLTGKSQLKATMLGIFFAIFYSGMAGGSLAWGFIAKTEGLSYSFYQAAVILSLVGLYKTYEAHQTQSVLAKTQAK